MKLSDFDYQLPKEMIAQHPVEPRDSSRLMILDGKDIEHMKFSNLPRLLRPGDLLVMNNSRVIPARIYGTKDTGGKIEVLLVRRLEDKYYECLVRGKIKPGSDIQFNSAVTGTAKDIADGTVKGTVIERIDTHTGHRYNIKFQCNGAFEFHLQNIGAMPVPPYIKEQLDDNERYQTIYSRHEGSIAAPTAGLHFTSGILSRLKEMGVRLVFITLHVGVGTFMPVRCEDVEEHIMESEYYIIDRAAADAINGTILREGRIIVVGTTSVRSLESAAWEDGSILPSEGWSNSFIYPPYKFKTPMSGLITNFHLPKSTLLMLVSAYAGKETIMNAYMEAIDTGYRFYSFGDAMFILNNNEGKHV
ncbi:MAG: tRNA preQ1(34) S-adenosylmethionine ribosyltransferase-isomerase QueA [ANME-2 cluster archaeon]|nr:tRNA preQ1(34) S-adenosylmethionine ribosyltransferase-isomerase QueA [ANME-2 cluster archaeon]MBC2702284.1 tRNA preQ1(34) S-adenosylmethionine ribosyltransferase-isomerase QueA [ANME-2 cluster archaeon]MBC2708412.1 tRNA preQ1(34) S-adenosylmethionine ribosyltransferase-isomerase QueA [ANME-2 cluster archaeon]MBC2745693.1 tRNA preQ1(34) S-adenosylmethionine ribosyltransferase-isomerase QueA [ANME-2 cluster archaeon]MBC2762114.1 tRNA preQ1(34) S-adenosylmethionine ribosyltransferase-isomerase